jgi:hypothetical protein
MSIIIQQVDVIFICQKNLKKNREINKKTEIKKYNRLDTKFEKGSNQNYNIFLYQMNDCSF